MLVNKIVVLLITFGLVPIASAGGFFEPYAGYEIGDQEQNNTSYDTKGPNLGFRVGYVVSEPIYLGLEYVLADLDVDRPSSDTNIKTTDVGLVIGGSLSSVRLWLTYWLSSTGNSDNPDTTYKGDGGYKFGLGFNVFGQVNFNVEKTLRIWKKDNNTTLSDNIEIDGMMISLSLPFTF